MQEKQKKQKRQEKQEVCTFLRNVEGPLSVIFI